jgi:hypothetical protein
MMAEHGDAKPTELFVTLANCPKARSASVLRSMQGGLRGAVAATIA